MNRRERRALERKGVIPKKEPTYMLKPSEIMQAAVKGPGKELLQQTVNKNVSKQYLDQDKVFTLALDSMVLWTLHSCCGWGYTRLRRFYLDMFREHIRMRKRYECEGFYPEQHKLKEETGVDVEAWYNALFDEHGNFRNPDEVELP